MRNILLFLIVAAVILSGACVISTPIGEASIEKIKVTFSQPQIREENGYVRIEFREANSYLKSQGKPLLPMYTRTFMYPFKTVIKSVTATEKIIETLQLDKDIIPTPQAHIAGEILTKSAEEQLTGVYPDKWFDYSVHTGLNGNERVVFLSIDVYPARYYKDDNIIKWVREVEINIDYNLPKNVVMDDKYNFIIICEDQFASQLESFCDYKNARISTKVVTLSDISNGRYFSKQGRDSAEQIKYFIKNSIENWNTYYVLLVGRNLPARDVHVKYQDDNEIFVSDLYYADIYNGEGSFSSWDTNNNNVFAEINWGATDDKLDLYPDVHLSRIPCNDVNELSTVLDKVVNYEINNAFLQDWFKKLIAVGGDSFTGNDVLEGEYANNHVINLMSTFSPIKIWVSEGNLYTKGPLNNAINSGAGLIHFSGHGNTNIWATHPYNDEETWLPKPTGGYLSIDISLLKNGEKLPIVVTGACSISKYNKDKNCFSYAWLKNPNGGGIGSFGATGLGWSYVGKDVTKGLNEGMVIETFKAYRAGATSLGEMWTGAVNSYIKLYRMKEILDYKTVLEWQCFGDPTLILRTPSKPPNKPDKPSGPTSGEVSKEYTYVTKTTDPDEDRVYYIFDWGDGTITQVGPFESGVTASATHKWSKSGSYRIRVKAKDEHGAVSDWSDPLPVRMPKSKALQIPIVRNFENILRATFFRNIKS